MCTKACIMALKARSLAWFSMAGLLVACSDDVIYKTADSNASSAGDVAFSQEVQPLSSFSYDTGLIPAGSPAQVQLKLGAGGGIKVEASGTPSANGLDGKPGSGKVALDLHITLDGHLKVDSMFKKIDDDLPGLKDIDIKIAGEQAFDPFLVNDGESARVEAKIPATDLPEIPLGSTPGKLKLSVAEGSVVRSWFRGSCVSVSGGNASYDGTLTTEGNIVLHGKLALDLPAPLNKEVDLGDITIPVSAGATPLDFGQKPAPGATDNQLGAKCGGGHAADPKGTSKPKQPKTKDDDGKQTTNPDTGEACLAWTCEDYGGECGDHDDMCGGSINCGTCQTPTACRPLTCAQLGASCGTHGDGCGGTVSCGACQTSCAKDALEPNNTKDQAVYLGSSADTDAKTLSKTQLEASDGDEDWFKILVSDRGFGGNPTVHASTTDQKLEVSAFHECDSLPNYSYCEGSGTQDNTVGHGCRATGGSVTLNTDCSGVNEDGFTYIRVRKMVSDGTCHSYDLRVKVD